MKGLLYKDWSLIAVGYRTNFLFLLVFYGLFTFAFQTAFLAYALVFILGMYASSTIALDENSHWDAYAHTLPVTAGQLVSVKYWLTLLFTAVGLVLSFLLLALLPEPKPSLTETALGLAAACAVTLLYFSFVIPLSYRFGATKARSWVSLTILVVAFGPVLLLSLMPDDLKASFRDTVEQLSGPITDSCPELVFTGLVIGLLAVFSLVVLVISWAISVRIYTRKTY